MSSARRSAPGGRQRERAAGRGRQGEPAVRPHPPPLDHGAVGNGRLIALISPTSAIEWLCLPYFHSPSVFARLVDRENGGTFRILYNEHELRGVHSYVPNTNVLSTVFEADGCRWEVIDFAPRLPQGLRYRAPFELARLIRPLAGQPHLRVDFDPRPDYARVRPELVQTASGLEVNGGPGRLVLSTNVPVPFVLARQAFVLNRPVFFLLTHGRRETRPGLASVQHELELTVGGWRAFARTCALPTFEPESVLRSALCLKLHSSHDTGAIIAAATTSIPEAMGTERAWDYRYCWLRDAAFVVEALRRIAHLDEGERFAGFLRDVAEAGPLQPLYGIDGSRDLPEELLPHLVGFGGNGHVRIGNAACGQRQNDLMGELMLCLYTVLTDPRLVHDDPQGFLPLIERLVEEAIAAAPTADMGIWEFRTMLRPYTFSRAMCWVAIERGARLARRLGREDLARRWEPIAAAEREEVLRRGFNRRLGFFTQELDGEYPDAANLLLPHVGLIEACDPQFVSTVEAYERLLVNRGLMLRYRNDDDFGETTSAFTTCSFWWAEALALCGRLDDAIALFHRIVSHANPVGLLSEDIDPATGALLGNFPQAYTHVGLIHAAMTIGEMLETRARRTRAWV